MLFFTQIVTNLFFFVIYIEETCMENASASIFKLSDLANLYVYRMEQFGTFNQKINTTRLKQRLLAQFPDM